MTHCTNCGASIGPSDDFCTSCGADLRTGSGNHERGPQGGQGEQAAGQAHGAAGANSPRGSGQVDQAGGRSGRQGPQGNPPQARGSGTSRRKLLLYGGGGAAVLAGVGGGWLLLGGGSSEPGFVDGFEDGIAPEWSGDTGAFVTAGDAMEGDQAARLAFGGGSDVWRSIPSGTPSEISFWWKTGAVDDNEFTVWFHDVADGDEPSMENAHFGFEVGAGNDQLVVTAPPFENRSDYEILLQNPRPGTWYRTRFTGIDFQSNTYDIELQDRNGEVIGNVPSVSFDGDPVSINTVLLRNHMNFSDAPAFIDGLTIKYDSQ